VVNTWVTYASISRWPVAAVMALRAGNRAVTASWR
jgi:hypothetical protein